MFSLQWPKHSEDLCKAWGREIWECLSLLTAGRQGPLEHFSSLQMCLGKLFHLCEHDNLLTSAIGCKFFKRKQKSLEVIVVSWTGMIEKGGLVTTLTWANHDLPALRSLPPACIRKTKDDWSTSAIPFCCLSTSVVFSCSNIHQDLLAQNSDSRVSCHWPAFECISGQLLMILAAVARGQ